MEQLRPWIVAQKHMTETEYLDMAIEIGTTYRQLEALAFDWSTYYPQTTRPEPDAPIVAWCDGDEPIDDDYALVNDTYIVSLCNLLEYEEDGGNMNDLHLQYMQYDDVNQSDVFEPITWQQLRQIAISCR